MTKAIGHFTRAARQANWLVPCVLATASALFTSQVRAQDPPAEESPPPAGPPAGDAPAEASAAPPPPPVDPAAAPEGAAAPENLELAGVEGELLDDGQLDEVVVTVDRRAKDLQKYSGTAAAFSERDLSRVGITNVRDLSAKVPGLQIGNQEGNTEVYIRGVGSDNNTELGDPAVSVHLDGIYLPRPRGMGAMFYDIARVEVNSGPQGTLRGRNAVGGSVNIVANQPKLGEYEANAQATFGTFALRQYQGMVNVPFGDVLALRVAAFSEVHDPHWENAGPIHDIKGPESIDSYSYRAQIKWQPMPRFNALAAFDYTAERGTGWLGANFQGPLTRTADPNDTPDDTSDDVPDPVDPEDIEDPRRIYNRGQQSAVDLKHWGTRLELNYDGGPVLVQALGSYRDMHFTQNNGGNAGVVYPGYGFSGDTPDNFGNAYWDQKSSSWVAELRLYAPDTSRFRWTVGGFFFDEQQDTFLGQTSDPAGGFGGGEFPMPETNGMSIAGYADGTFDVAESFRVLGGVRVTRETKDRFGGMWSLWTGFPNLPNGDSPRFGTEGFQYWGTERTQFALPQDHDVEDRVSLFLDGIKSFGARDEVAQALCADPIPEADGTVPSRLDLEDGHFSCAFGVHPQLLDGENEFGITVTPQNNEVKDTFVDWRAGFEFDAGERNLLYGTVSTGHKVGGFNDTSGGGPAFIDTEYGTESVLAFELGSKNQFLDRRLRLNASAFYYRYSDQVFQQVVAVVPPDDEGMGGSNTAVRANATSSNIYGLDLDVVYALPAGFEAEVHALLMDARFGDDVIVNDGRIGFDVSEYEVDIGGNWLPRTSAVTLNYALSQMIPTEAGIFDWIIGGQFRSQHFMTVFNGEGNLLPEVNDNIPVNDMGVPLASYATVAANPARLTDVVPAYNRIDIGAGWRHPDSRISISGFVNNVFDTTYVTSIIATPGLNLRFFNPPRVAGVRFRVDW